MIHRSAQVTPIATNVMNIALAKIFFMVPPPFNKDVGTILPTVLKIEFGKLVNFSQTLFAVLENKAIPLVLTVTE